MNSQKGLIGWIVLIFIVIVSVVVAFAVINYSTSLPGDSAYPLKQLTEEFRLFASDIDFSGRASAYLDMSVERLDELQQLIKQKGKDTEIIQTLIRLDDEEDKAITNLGREKNRGNNIGESLTKFETLLLKQQTILQNLSYDVLGDTQEALQKAYLQTDETLSRVRGLNGR